MILGNTAGETRTLIGRGDPTLFELTWDTLPPSSGELARSWARSTAPRSSPPYRAWYPHYSPADVFFAATTASRSWRGQVIEADRRAVQPRGAAHTWVFQFDWRTPVDGGRWGAHHGLDVPFSFDNAAIVPDKVGTGADALGLSRRDERRWLAFARTGRPATPSLPEWPVYDLASRRDDDLRSRGARGRRSARRRTASLRAGAVCAARHVAIGGAAVLVARPAARCWPSAQNAPPAPAPIAPACSRR